MGKRVVHIEFPAQDIDRGKRFWEGVGGWTLNDAGMPGIQYLMFQDGDQGGAVYSMEGQSGRRSTSAATTSTASPCRGRASSVSSSSAPAQR